MTEEKIVAMTPQKQKYYVQAMQRLQGKERLVMMDANQYPVLESKDKQKKHREVYRVAYPESFKDKILRTTDLELI
jgi:hypothetical protein